MRTLIATAASIAGSLWNFAALPQRMRRDIMSTKVICTRPDQSVQECMAVMTARAVRHLPVLEHGQLVGIVSIGDMVNSVIGDQKFIIEQLEHYIHGDR